MKPKNEYCMELEGIEKEYSEGEEGVRALRGISLRIGCGERIGLMGKSGSGKSTLLHIMGLLDIPSKGNVLIDGINTSAMSGMELARIRRTRLGFVFQQFHLITTLTAKQNVMLPMVFCGVAKPEREKRAAGLLEELGMAHRLEHLPSKLSGGEKQRVAIARALANSPDIILADEPTGNLDSAAGKDVMGIFSRLHDEGKTIIVVTHDEDVGKESERIIRIKDGLIDREERIRKQERGTR